MEDVFLVTGALGCFGSWVLYHLAAAGEKVVALDLDTNPVRPALLLSPEQLGRINFVQGDLTNLAGLKAVMEKWQVSHVIHVAALQIPFCRNNPPLGARVNVEGTINVLEAVRSGQAAVKGLVYASSVAVFGPESYYAVRPVPDSAPLFPQTLYGVYKQADENAARVYWQDWHVASIGLRPYTAYGVARDQGTTSDLTKAILAAVAGRPYHIRFDGMVALQYASDIAAILIACAHAGFAGAATCNLRNDVISVQDFIDVVTVEVPGAQITCERDKPLPFPADLDGGGLRRIIGKVPHTPLVQAVHETAVAFRSLLVQKRIDLAQLEG